MWSKEPKNLFFHKSNENTDKIVKKKKNFFNILEFNQRLATSQGIFIQEKWLNLGKIFVAF